MKRKGKKSKENLGKGLKVIFLGIFAICFLGIFLLYNITKSNREVKDWNRYAIIGKDNIFVVYEKKLAVRIPHEIQIDKDTKFQDLVDKKNYREILETINGILPEKVENYKVVNYGEVDLDVKNAKNIPETVIDDKRYILTSSMHSMFESLYSDVEKSLTGELVIDILNANGKSGYAKYTGEKLKKKFPMMYNASNYETNTEYSYVVVNEIDKERLQQLVMEVDEKYFKIKEETNIPTMANIILVLGKEQTGLLDIHVVGNKDSAASTINSLKENGYKNIKSDKKESKVESSVIEYNPEDYYIAYKIGQKLSINNMIEKNDLKNRINILCN